MSVPPPHLAHVLRALLVTFLWSTSWVLIKVGLTDIPALTFAGLRYALAALVLLPFVLRGGRLSALRGLSVRTWRDLLLLGVVMFAITQGAQFLALAHLPAATLSLVLSFSPLVVALLAAAALREGLGLRQGVGIAAVVVGALIYFGPSLPPFDQRLGLVIAAVGLLANSVAGVLARAINRSRTLDPLLVTLVSMSVGALLLLGSGVATGGLPTLTWATGPIVAWLAIVNTALAFTLWNATLRHLTAVESSVINNTMLIQIAALAWLFLGESLGALQLVGITIVTIGTVVVQWRRAPTRPDRAGRRPGMGTRQAVAAAPLADPGPPTHPGPPRRSR